MPSLGIAIINIRFTGLPSRDLKSTPSSTVIAVMAGLLTASVIAWGIAIPPPMPVLVLASRSKTAFLNESLSFRLPSLK